MKNIISLILIGAAVWLFWSYTDPLYKEAQGLKEVQADYQVKLDQVNEMRRKYDGLAVNYQSFSEVALTRLSRLVPDTVDTVRLVMDVSDIATRYGLLVKNIKISEPPPSSMPISPGGAITPEVVRIGSSVNYNSIGLGFSVTGPYEKFIAFLKDLEKSLRILDVTGIKFSSGADSTKGNNYDFDVNLKTYWLKWTMYRNKSKKGKVLTITIGVIIVAFIGYSFLFGSGEDNAALVLPQGVNQNQTASGILSLLAELSALNLATTVLNNPVFTSLQDFSREIPNEPAGRNNPFAPI